jgi:hypothetical protein
VPLRSLIFGIAATVWLAHPGPAAAQDPDSIPPEAENDRIEDEYEDDDEPDPRLQKAIEAYLAEIAAMTPPEIVEDTTAPGVQAGGTELRLVVPGTEILVREDGDDPGDVPPPPVYGEEICPTGNVRGQFEPAQGVWQDDPTFADRPGKQIVKLSPVLWRAELPMVTGRRTLLHGIAYARGAEPRRNEIFVKGEATGSDRIPVKFRFTLKQPGVERVIYESEVLIEIPIGGPCRPGGLLPFEVSLEAPNGVPPDVDFTIDQDGEYLLEAEVVTADGRPTGIKVGVLGRSATTHAPKLAFRVVTMLRSARESASTMDQAAILLSAQSGSRIPDLYPIRNERLTTRVFRPRNRADLLDVLARQPRLNDLAAESGDGYFEEGIREELVRQLQIAGLMSGFDRIVVLVSDGDFRLLWSGSVSVQPKFDAGGFAPAQKLVFVNIETDPNPLLVAHEIVHTLPYIFSVSQMLAECGLNYHNTFGKVGHGHRVTRNLMPGSRERMDGSTAVMSGASGWISQCSYRHLLEALARGVPDPPVLLVQGFIARTADGPWGFLQPFYDLMGIEDLPVGGEGEWAIVLRDARGDVLARHSWEPQWYVPDVDVERSLVAFAFRLLPPDGLASVELEGPGGLLDVRTLSASIPIVTISTPTAGGAAEFEAEGVRVRWSGTDPDGDALLYTVLYSSDAGETWEDVEVETAETSAVAPIDPEAPVDAHRVLVRVTDGGRSADAVVAFRPAE